MNEDDEQLNHIKTYCWAILKPLNLWDTRLDCPDETQIKELYMNMP